MNKMELDLSQFTGTSQYYKGWCNVDYTDGVFYLTENGMSWFVTDVCSVVKVSELKNQEFVSVELKVNADNSADAIYTDGNGVVLYKQHYDHCDGQNVTLFFTKCYNILMLNREYQEVKMGERIKLYWAVKFRGLLENEGLNDREVIREFEKFANEEEQAINDRWRAK